MTPGRPLRRCALEESEGEVMPRTLVPAVRVDRRNVIDRPPAGNVAGVAVPVPQSRRPPSTKAGPKRGVRRASGSARGLGLAAEGAADAHWPRRSCARGDLARSHLGIYPSASWAHAPPINAGATGWTTCRRRSAAWPSGTSRPPETPVLLVHGMVDNRSIFTVLRRVDQSRLRPDRDDQLPGLHQGHPRCCGTAWRRGRANRQARRATSRSTSSALARRSHRPLLRDAARW